MVLEKKPFTRYNEEKKQDVITIKLNAEERAELEHMKKVIRQPKDGTAIKQLMVIGAKVILTPWMGQLLETLFNNERKNKRMGISEYEYDFRQK